MALTQEKRNVLIDAITENCGSCEQDRLALETMSDETLAILTMNAFPVKKAANEEMAEEEDDPEEEMDEEAPPPKGKASGKATCNEEQVQNRKDHTVARSAAEWLSEAPAEIRTAVQNAMDIVGQEKETIVSRLVSNVSKDKQEATRNSLLKKSIEELREIEALVPQKPVSFAMNQLGAGAPINRLPQDGFKSDEDLLIAPTINWKSN